MATVTIVIPACVILGRKKRYLNLNHFRNWHHTICHKTKERFNLLVLNEFQSIPRMKYINQIEYTLIVPSKRRRDRMNVYSIVDKYFCDALQKYNKIEDDSDEFIGDFVFKQSVYMKDKAENIRVSVKITFDC
jgi:hypothetical protein